VGDALAFLGQVHRRSRVAVVGLGVGTLAAYGGSGERWTFIEIDPSIVRTARDLGHFTYLRDSAASVDVVLGDGRKRLLAMPDGAFDVILLDAFSSDAVPAHLLTAEALATYVRKLAARGVLLVHTSNRYMALTDVLAAAATHLSLVGWIGETSPSEEEHRAGKSASEWVLLARRAEDFRPAPDPEIWEPLPPGDPRHLWTDERTSLLPVLDL
jgi:spermidine synthase